MKVIILGNCATCKGYLNESRDAIGVTPLAEVVEHWTCMQETQVQIPTEARFVFVTVVIVGVCRRTGAGPVAGCRGQEAGAAIE